MHTLRNIYGSTIIIISIQRGTTKKAQYVHMCRRTPWADYL